MKAKKKPIVINTILHDGSADKIYKFLKKHDVPERFLHISYNSATSELTIPTEEGPITAQPGDYIIIGVQGEVYPCKPDIFKQTYEVLE